MADIKTINGISRVSTVNGISTQSVMLATGQTTSYVDYDDGYYEKGIVKAYTVLTAGQYSGTTNITLNGKTDAHSNNAVVDNNTGLMWSRYVSASVGTSSNGNLPWTTNVNGEGIFAFCAAANAASLGGYTDWRVPNFMELISLIDGEPSTGAPDVTAFPNGISTCWTSSVLTTDVTKALVIFLSGQSLYSALKTADARVILVRG